MFSSVLWDLEPIFGNLQICSEQNLPLEVPFALKISFEI